MENLMKTEVMTSREIAELTGKRHDAVLRDIRNLVAQLGEADANFAESEYVNDRGKTYPQYLLPKSAVYYLNQQYKNKRLAEFCGQQAIVCTTRFETSFGEQLIQTLNPIGINVEVQKPVCGKYRIDFYLPKYKLAIEYDEQQHQFQHEADNKRMEDIKKELGCSFVRLDYKNTDATNVGIVLSNILKTK